MLRKSTFVLIIYCFANCPLTAKSDDDHHHHHHTTTEKPIITPKTVCYPTVGCFNNSVPYDNAGGAVPLPPDKLGISFLLYMRQIANGAQSQKLSYTDDALNRKSLFDIHKKTKIITHGFGKDETDHWLHETKDELLKIGDFNVIIVGWGLGASYPDYSQAIANTRIVARLMSKLLTLLHQRGANLDDFHLIGHSLGAHVMGYVGASMHGRVARISGLDPADPGYQDRETEVRLDASDAKFVDVVHTNGDPIYEGGFGMIQQCGHVDFYVNGGKSQPGCIGVVTGLLSTILSGNVSSVSKATSCSHGRAHDLFKLSINSLCPFTAFPCSDYETFLKGNCLSCGSRGCSQFGYYSDQYPARGKMYLETLGTKPFCGFHYGIKIEGSNNTKPTKGSLSVRLNGTLHTSQWMPITEDSSEHFDPGTFYSTVIISDVDVGDAITLDIKYEKYGGIIFGWGSGEDTFTARTLLVTSGESHQTYEFCLEDRPLQHQREVRLDVTHRRKC